jgi:outer membrane receptor protein involved in Fe transport
LIQWTPRGSIWQPINIQRVSRKGWKINWSGAPTSWHLKPVISASEVRAIDQSSGESHGKQLPYVPIQTWSVSLNWSYRSWEVTYSIRHRGTMISRYDWPQDVRLPSVRLQDFSVGTAQTWGPVTIQLGLNLENLTDESYESVQGYPEPGRSLLFTLTIQPHQEK